MFVTSITVLFSKTRPSSNWPVIRIADESPLGGDAVSRISELGGKSKPRTLSLLESIRRCRIAFSVLLTRRSFFKRYVHEIAGMQRLIRPKRLTTFKNNDPNFNSEKGRSLLLPVQIYSIATIGRMGCKKGGLKEL